ncbi:MAG TPA: TetR/AcrR family transcriptional regulator [Ureibacillus sp.]|nr:TetR/AcrR family transcriptional regulator [Ureibacillus sp.]
MEQKKGLTINTIIETATKLVEEKGYNNFSLRELAGRLNVKAASLYYHISGVDDITKAVGELASERMNQAFESATKGKERDAAVSALAHAYRKYVKENPELYLAIMGVPLSDDKDLSEQRMRTISPIYEIMGQYRISKEEIMHCQRIFRSTLHGFTMLEASGFFQAQDTNVDESFDFLIQNQVLLLHSLEDCAEKNDEV